MTRRRTFRWVQTGALTAGLAIVGCATAPVVPIGPTYAPITLQKTPGVSEALARASVIYVVVNSTHTDNRVIIPELMDIVADELRGVTSAQVIPLPDTGIGCPPIAGWREVCRACNVPVGSAPEDAVVLFCDLLKYDPYSPLRVSLSLRVRKVADGADLNSLQGAWEGTAQLNPTKPGFRWPWVRVPPGPRIEEQWTRQLEAYSAPALLRSAVHDSIATLLHGSPDAQMMASGQYMDSTEYCPPEGLMPSVVPPTLPELPSVPTPDLTGSDWSVPEESHPTP